MYEKTEMHGKVRTSKEHPERGPIYYRNLGLLQETMLSIPSQRIPEQSLRLMGIGLHKIKTRKHKKKFK